MNDKASTTVRMRSNAKRQKENAAAMMLATKQASRRQGF
jgi:hypothetical protein